MLLVHTVVPLLLIEAAKCPVIFSVPRMDFRNSQGPHLLRSETTAKGQRSAEKDIVSLDSGHNFVM